MSNFYLWVSAIFIVLIAGCSNQDNFSSDSSGMSLEEKAVLEGKVVFCTNLPTKAAQKIADGFVD